MLTHLTFGPHKRTLALALGLVTATTGCQEGFDTTRQTEIRSTVGAELYKVACNRLAAEALPKDVDGSETDALCDGRETPGPNTPARLAALAKNRARFIAAADKILPEPELDDVEEFTRQLLPFYQAPSEQLPKQTRALAKLIDSIIERRDALQAVARLGQREGYRPLSQTGGLATDALSYPDFAIASRSLLQGIREGGVATDSFDELNRVMSLELASFDAANTDRTLRDLLLKSDPSLGTGAPLYVVERDTRGIALPAMRDGEMTQPFADRNNDGLADVDADGLFVDRTGERLAVATPFATTDAAATGRDAQGRAIDANGDLLYDYKNIDETVLAAVLREAQVWLRNRDVGLDAAAALPAILGPTAPQEKQYSNYTLRYQGHDIDQSPLLDVAYAATTLIDRPELAPALKGLSKAIEQDEGAFADLGNVLWYAVDRKEAFPNAKLEEGNTLQQDIVDWTERAARSPGLLEALLRAFGDPRTARLGDVYGNMMLYNDFVGTDPAHFNTPRKNVRFVSPVDPSAPNTLQGMSMFQRTITLIAEMNGVQLCNKANAQLKIYFDGVELLGWPTRYPACDLIQINNMAELYSQSVIHRADLQLGDALLTAALIGAEQLNLTSASEVIEYESGIDGLTTSPTPEALGRLVFAPRNEFMSNILDAPRGASGEPIEEMYPGTVFAWEKEYTFNDGEGAVRATLGDGMTPLLSAFDTYDRREDGRFLFADLMTTVASHWPDRYDGPDAATQNDAPDLGRYAVQSNLRSFEPLLAELLIDQQLLQRIRHLAIALDNTEVAPGVDGIDAISALLEATFDSRNWAGLRTRQGEPVSSAGDLLLKSLQHASEAIDDAEPSRKEASERALKVLMHQLFDTTYDPGSNPIFRNPHTPALIRFGLDTFVERLEEETAANHRSTWGQELYQDAETLVASPMTAAGVRLVDDLRSDANKRGEIEGLTQYFLRPTADGGRFDTLVVALGEALDLASDRATTEPLAHALAPALADNIYETLARGEDPTLETSVLGTTLDLIEDIQAVDREDVLTGILRRALDRAEPGEASALSELVDILGEVNRQDAGEQGALDADDYRVWLERSNSVLTDPEHGIERAYRVIQSSRVK